MSAHTLEAKLRAYVRAFNETDEEHVQTHVPNRDAAEFLLENAPLFACPDKAIEETYYFRWWTLRKHVKKTPAGFIFTEFLKPVSWSGAYNSINCAAGLHIRESRWMRDPANITAQYIDFWLNGGGDALAYSAWYAHAVREYCAVKGDDGFAAARLPALVRLYEARERAQLTPCGLFWANDNRDGMEYSISGPGLRPTINSYMAADARAIAHFARLAGDRPLADAYEQKAEGLLTRMRALLWDRGFYRTLPVSSPEKARFEARPEADPAHDARELIGYIPWYFNLAEPGGEGCFAALTDPRAFAAPCGPATAERCHPRYREVFSHECLWNGPSWPFATSQTLVALANALQSGRPMPVTKDDYFALLRAYARSHRRTLASGRTVPWIDENLDPDTGAWISRDILEGWDWREDKGGRERGKDYNHSLFCDLVLSGLLGIRMMQSGAPEARPLIPDSWEFFRVENLCCPGGMYTVDYRRGAGVTFAREGEKARPSL